VSTSIDKNLLTVTILDKEYRIACNKGEEEDLLSSAKFLNSRMNDIRKSGKVIGTERVAVMAALNIAHELLTHQGNDYSTATEQRIQNLRERVEVALNNTKQLEF